MMKQSDYDLLNSLDMKELVVLGEALSICADIELIIDKALLDKDNININKSLKKDIDKICA